MAHIPLDASFGPELVEFWGKKYKDVKEEIELLKKSHSEELERVRCAREQGLIDNVLRIAQDLSNGTVNPANTQLIPQSARENNDLEMCQKLALLEKDVNVLKGRLLTVEMLKDKYQLQVQTFYSQVMTLAMEVDANRKNAIARLFPPHKFVDDDFEPDLLPLTSWDMPKVLAVLPNAYSSRWIVWMRCPPAELPCRISSRATSGYCFYPAFDMHSTMDFELILEGPENMRRYLGSYRSAAMPFEYGMKLSEWMCLGEQTKMEYCTRVASINLPPNQVPPYHVQLDLKRQYDTGKWMVPCFSLQCVGFDMIFYQNFRHAVSQARPTVSKPASPIGSESSSDVASLATTGEKRLRVEVAESSEAAVETPVFGKKPKLG